MVQEENGLVRKHFLISGRVQGVGYRYSMLIKARELGLKGWCRNLHTGEVEAEVVGSPETVDKLLKWCYQGPPHADITDVEIQNLPLESIPRALYFEIRH